MNRKFRALLLSSVFLAPFTLASKTVIFDLGNVLLGTSRFGVAQTIGLTKFIGYTFLDRKNPANLQTTMFDVLEQLGTQQQAYNAPCACDGTRPLPQIMCHWLNGTCSGYDIIRVVYEHIDTLYQNKNYFCSAREKNLIKAMIEAVFDPHILAHNMYVIEQGRKLVELCKNHGHRVMILSNFDTLTYLHLLQKPDVEELLNLFEPEDIVISGAIQMIKPHREIYSYVLDTYNLDPNECIFIDDQPENICAAQSMGITGILCNTHDNVQARLTTHLGI